MSFSASTAYELNRSPNLSKHLPTAATTNIPSGACNVVDTISTTRVRPKTISQSRWPLQERGREEFQKKTLAVGICQMEDPLGQTSLALQYHDPVVPQ